MSKVPKLFAAMLVVAVLGGRAASIGAALSQRKPAKTAEPVSFPLPHAAGFRELEGRGLLVRTWVNGIGPFNFAIDTGAGATLVSERVAEEARVNRTTERMTSIAGLSGIKTVAYHAAAVSLAVGDNQNSLPSRGEVMITGALPNDLDGVLDPTEAFSPLGYVIDLPGHELSAFEPLIDPLRLDRQPSEGAVVRWLREASGRRPFVQLDNGDRALIDTGSSLGLAIRDTDANQRSAAYSVRDIGGGSISSRRVITTTISIGSLTLRRIPTDLISGAEADVPALLGIRALRPFRLRFDPLHRLIEIAPTPR